MVTHIEDFPACPCRAVRWGCACVRSVLRAVPVRRDDNIFRSRARGVPVCVPAFRAACGARANSL